MQRLFLACVFMFLLPVASQAITFAQLALGGGYEAVLLISNKTNHGWSGTIWVSRGFDQRWEGRWAINGEDRTGTDGTTVTIPRRGLVKLRLTGDSVTRAGYLEVKSDFSYSDLDIAVSYFYEYRIAGVLKDTVGSPESPAGRSFVFAVERSSAIDTGIAWCPFSRINVLPFQINLTLYDQDGNVARQRSYDFIGHQAQFLTQLFTDLPSPFVGHLAIESLEYFYLEVLRLETTPTGFQLTSTPADNHIP